MLSDANKYRVIFALGYSGEILTETSMHFNSIVRDRMNIDNEFVEARILALLDEIDAIKIKFSKSPTNSNLKSIGDIELDTEKSHLLIGKEFNRLLRELSNLLGLTSNSGSSGMNRILL